MFRVSALGGDGDLTMTTTALSSLNLRLLLRRCGYVGDLLQEQVSAGGGLTVPLVGFAHRPFDARSSCVAVIEGNGDSGASVALFRHLGAPIVFVPRQTSLEWWKQGRHQPEQIENIPAARVESFFKKHATELAPEKVYRAKAWASVDRGYQLSFVDFGLLPVIEEEVGTYLTDLIERTVGLLAKRLVPAGQPSVQQGQWVLRSAFWLVAAKILKDKRVPGFRALDLLDVNSVFRQVAGHYGEHTTSYSGPKEHALREAAQVITQFSYLGHVTTESLSYIYESALVEKAVRRDLGIHSTPPCLVDYIIGRLAPWIQDIPADKRHVFEPACGHAAFLVAAMRLLRDRLPPAMSEEGQRKRYLRAHLHGIETDRFALEIARLSLTLADIPNPNSWQLHCTDIFKGDVLKARAEKSMVLLANPPFENFKAAEREAYAKQHAPVTYVNKTAEMLGRTLPYMPEGSVFGVVVPQSMLQSDKAKALRKDILSDFEIADICLFPDKMFRFSDVESAVIIGRRVSKVGRTSKETSYARVREHDVKRFREDHSVTYRSNVPIERLSQRHWEMLIPDMPELWEWCGSLPKLRDLADVGQGLIYKGKHNLPANARTIERREFKGAVRGYAKVGHASMIHGVPDEVHMSLEPSILRRALRGTRTGVPQVILNYAPVSRGPWRIKAFLDPSGHAATSDFMIVRPKSARTPLVYLWALLNSPVANAYAYAHTGKRTILVGVLRELPVPRASEPQIEAVVQKAKAYLDVARRDAGLSSPRADCTVLHRLLREMDAEVLRLYDIPARMERAMLDIFADKGRAGVPPGFPRYYPEDFTPCFHLHEYLTDDYKRSTAGELLKRTTPQASEAFLAALDRAVGAFRE